MSTRMIKAAIGFSSAALALTTSIGTSLAGGFGGFSGFGNCMPQQSLSFDWDIFNHNPCQQQSSNFCLPGGSNTGGWNHGWPFNVGATSTSSQNATSHNDASTSVNNFINATSENDSNVTQIGGASNGANAQSANVSNTASTDVSNFINATSANESSITQL